MACSTTAVPTVASNFSSKGASPSLSSGESSAIPSCSTSHGGRRPQENLLRKVVCSSALKRVAMFTKSLRNSPAANSASSSRTAVTACATGTGFLSKEASPSLRSGESSALFSCSSSPGLHYTSVLARAAMPAKSLRNSPAANSASSSKAAITACAAGSGFLSKETSPSLRSGESSANFPCSSSPGLHEHQQRRNSPREVVVCSSVLSTTPAFPPRSGKELQEQFGTQGLTFAEVGGLVTAEMKLENGCSARVLLSRAQVTSYKAHMWHGGEEEMLYSARPRSAKLRASAIRGGIELRFSHSQDPLSSILPSSTDCWTVEDVRCEPSNYSQITLTSLSSPELGTTHDPVKGSLQFRYVVTLTDRSLASALMVSNVGLHPVEFTGSIVTHLAVSSAESTFAVGLRECGYRCLSSIAAKRAEKLSKRSNFWSRLWGSPMAENPGQDSPSHSGSSDLGLELERGRWVVEDDDASQLHGGVDRLYPTPPTSFSLLDRGFRRSVLLERSGFEEFCLSNPGPESKVQDWDNFICVGPTQSSQPVRLQENEEWGAAQILFNIGYD